MESLEIIAFTGSAGSGKTTLMQKLKEKFEQENIKVSAGYILRTQESLDFEIEKLSNEYEFRRLALRYMLAMVETINQARKEGSRYLLLDSYIIDIIPYLITNDNISKQVKNEIFSEVLARTEIMPVDYLIFCEPIKLADNYQRRKAEVAMAFLDMLESFTFYIVREQAVELRIESVIDIITPKNIANF